MPRLPEQLLNSLEGLDGFERRAFEEAHESANRITSLRLNPFKPVELDFALSKPVPWCDGGYYLNERPSFTNDPLFHGGCYYVQEAGSMFVDFAARQLCDTGGALRVLDSCAAPGGKSTLLDSLLSCDGLLVANEVVKARAGVLSVNLGRWGTCNTIVTNSDPPAFSKLDGYFDLVLTDAPCSGSGLFRKQPEAIAEWSPAVVEACCTRQKKILEDLLPCIRPGGLLFYSTCSYSPEENEMVSDWLLSEADMEYCPLDVPPAWGLIDTGKGYRFYPHLTASEGFFFAAFRKIGAGGGSRNNQRSKQKSTRQELPGVSEFIQPAAGESVISRQNRLHLVNSAVSGFLGDFEGDFYLRKAGTALGEMKGRDFVPHQELSWSIRRNPDLPALELGTEEARRYLRKQDINPGTAVPGLRLVSYKTVGIGWAKVLEKRLNNYLPAELRILR
jgi:16S rRNA C967 or C1407 C5-methylase (RsmB/RsmF family)/NOL1/NOP2/fmu family ribosome biogenesis protein